MGKRILTENDIEPTFDPTSENAVSGKALKPVFDEKISLHFKGNEYKKGETIVVLLQDHIVDPDGTYIEREYSGIIRCKNENGCVVDSVVFDINDDDFKENWELLASLSGYYSVYAQRTDRAYMDRDGNEITETYATQEELTNIIGDISTALDDLHAYAQALVGGAE